MPRAPSYQPGQVNPVQITDARFRAANNNGGVVGGLAEGLQGAGNAVANFADAQDKLNAQNDDTQARALASEAQLAYSQVTTQFELKQGGAAREAQGATDQQLKDLREATLAKAANGRQRRFLEERLDPVHNSALVTIGRHAVKEQQVERAGTLDAEIASTTEWAASLTDPAQRDAAIAKVSGLAQQRLQEIDGYDPETSPDVFKLASLKATDAVHGQVLDRMFTSPDPQIDEITAYVDAYGDEMLSGTRNDVLKRLQQPLQERITRSDADVVGLALGKDAITAGTAPPIDGSGIGPWQGVAVNVANQFGLDPSDVAAVMSYETSGTFSPTIMGGTGGKYMGLIQFGQAERAKYGIDAKSTPAQWTRAITGFLTDRGFKRGMGVLDLYSTINAGTPGRYNASDGNGTVRTHVDKILADHKTKAIAWLGQAGAAYSNAPREWDKAKVYAQIDAVAEREGWSPERTERARKEWDSRISRDEGLLDEQYAAANDEASRLIAERNVSSISQLPMDLRKRMNPTKLAELDRGFKDKAEAERKAAAEKAESAASTKAKLELEIMKRLDPEGFKRLDLSGYVGRLTADQYTSYWLDQQTERTKPTQTDDYRSGIQGEITWAKKYDQVEIDDADFPAVYDTMAGYLRGLGKKPAPEDYRAAFKFATQGVRTTTTYLGFIPGGSGSKPRYEVTEVPPNFRAQFIRNWRGGGKPSEAQILDGYRRWVK